MPTVSFAAKAEGLGQVVENRFLEYVEERMGKTAPRLLELRAPRSGFRGESVVRRTHEHMERQIDYLAAVQNYETAVERSRIFSSTPSGHVSPPARFRVVKPSATGLPPAHLRAYDPAVHLVPFALNSPTFWESSDVGLDQIQDASAHLDASHRLLTPPPCGLRVEVGVGEAGLGVEPLRRLAALVFATGRLVRRCERGDARPDQYDVFDLMVDLGLGAEANMMQKHILTMFLVQSCDRRGLRADLPAPLVAGFPVVPCPCGPPGGHAAG